MKRHWWYAVAALGLVAVVVVVLVAVNNQGPETPAQPALDTPQNLQAVVNGPVRAKVGRPVEFIGEAVGSAAKPRVVAFCFDNGPCEAKPTECADVEPAAPKTATVVERRKHTFTRAGRYTVRFKVDGGCTGYSGSASAVATITVAP